MAQILKMEQSTANDSNFENSLPKSSRHIVKRISVPDGLEDLLKNLTVQVLKNQPNDIYRFAADYFGKMCTLRDQIDSSNKIENSEFSTDSGTPFDKDTVIKSTTTNGSGRIIIGKNINGKYSTAVLVSSVLPPSANLILNGDGKHDQSDNSVEDQISKEEKPSFLNQDDLESSKIENNSETSQVSDDVFENDDQRENSNSVGIEKIITEVKSDFTKMKSKEISKIFEEKSIENSSEKTANKSDTEGSESDKSTNKSHSAKRSLSKTDSVESGKKEKSLTHVEEEIKKEKNGETVTQKELENKISSQENRNSVEKSESDASVTNENVLSLEKSDEEQIQSSLDKKTSGRSLEKQMSVDQTIYTSENRNETEIFNNKSSEKIELLSQNSQMINISEEMSEKSLEKVSEEHKTGQEEKRTTELNESSDKDEIDSKTVEHDKSEDRDKTIKNGTTNKEESDSKSIGSEKEKISKKSLDDENINNLSNKDSEIEENVDGKHNEKLINEDNKEEDEVIVGGGNENKVDSKVSVDVTENEEHAISSIGSSKTQDSLDDKTVGDTSTENIDKSEKSQTSVQDNNGGKNNDEITESETNDIKTKQQSLDKEIINKSFEQEKNEKKSEKINEESENNEKEVLENKNEKTNEDKTILEYISEKSNEVKTELESKPEQNTSLNKDQPILENTNADKPVLENKNEKNNEDKSVSNESEEKQLQNKEIKEVGELNEKNKSIDQKEIEISDNENNKDEENKKQLDNIEIEKKENQLEERKEKDDNSKEQSKEADEHDGIIGKITNSVKNTTETIKENIHNVSEKIVETTHVIENNVKTTVSKIFNKEDSADFIANEQTTVNSVVEKVESSNIEKSEQFLSNEKKSLSEVVSIVEEIPLNVKENLDNQISKQSTLSEKDKPEEEEEELKELHEIKSEPKLGQIETSFVSKKIDDLTSNIASETLKLPTRSSVSRSDSEDSKDVVTETDGQNLLQEINISSVAKSEEKNNSKTHGIDDNSEEKSDKTEKTNSEAGDKNEEEVSTTEQTTIKTDYEIGEKSGEENKNIGVSSEKTIEGLIIENQSEVSLEDATSIQPDSLEFVDEIKEDNEPSTPVEKNEMENINLLDNANDINNNLNKILQTNEEHFDKNDVNVKSTKLSKLFENVESAENTSEYLVEKSEKNSEHFDWNDLNDDDYEREPELLAKISFDSVYSPDNNEIMDEFARDPMYLDSRDEVDLDNPIHAVGQAALKIQAAWRSYTVRKSLKGIQEKEIEEDDDKVKIITIEKTIAKPLTTINERPKTETENKVTENKIIENKVIEDKLDRVTEKTNVNETENKTIEKEGRVKRTEEASTNVDLSLILPNYKSPEQILAAITASPHVSDKNKQIDVNTIDSENVNLGVRHQENTEMISLEKRPTSDSLAQTAITVTKDNIISTSSEENLK